MLKYCYICYSKKVDEDHTCDICDNFYCYDCSYTFSLHYQWMGNACYDCCNQSRKSRLTKEIIRDNKLEIFLEIKK